MNFGISDAITRRHIRDDIEEHKIESGCGGTLFENNYTILMDCITPPWITHTWKFMWERNTIVQ